MTGPQAAPVTVSRGSRNQQPRALEAGRRVRVVGEDDVLLEVCGPERLGRYLAAPNAEVKRRKDGSIRLVRVRSVGDDRGHLGEQHGRSTMTTERVRGQWGAPVGTDSKSNLQHKASNAAWGAPAVKVLTE